MYLWGFWSPSKCGTSSNQSSTKHPTAWPQYIHVTNQPTTYQRHQQRSNSELQIQHNARRQNERALSYVVITTRKLTWKRESHIKIQCPKAHWNDVRFCVGAMTAQRSRRWWFLFSTHLRQVIDIVPLAAKSRFHLCLVGKNAPLTHNGLMADITWVRRHQELSQTLTLTVLKFLTSTPTFHPRPPILPLGCTRCSGVVVEYQTRNREVAGSTHTRSTASNLEQVANLLCAQANSVSSFFFFSYACHQA